MSQKYLSMRIEIIVCKRCLMKATRTYRLNAKSQLGGNLMNTQIPNPSVTLSMMISETAYKAVVGVEHLLRIGRKALGLGG